VRTSGNSDLHLQVDMWPPLEAYEDIMKSEPPPAEWDKRVRHGDGTKVPKPVEGSVAETTE